MGKAADAILCELLARNNCLMSATGIFQPAEWGAGANSQDLSGMVANYASSTVGMQCGTLVFAHSSQVLAAWMLMFTKEQDVSQGLLAFLDELLLSVELGYGSWH